jgi:PPK2 family polyphosphate:nucleotide phosphotransferase
MEEFRVKPGMKVDLSQWDPEGSIAISAGKKEAQQTVEDQLIRLDELQELLYAEHKHRLLVVLQAMDTAGKDSTIRHVFRGVNPQGVRVASFKVPTPIELDHDFLWRIHPHTPGLGEIAIFNRSHYEDVLVVRVHKLVPEEVWRNRYAEINAFERELADEGTTILKFFLYISPEEQKQRLQERLDVPRKRWKFSSADLKERKLWPRYMKAYQEALSQTSTEWAPWYIVPANRQWYRNLIVSTVLVQTLEGLKMSYPEPEKGWEQAKIL